MEIDPLEPRLTVWNDGRGIPVELHPTEQLYVPELIFGHLLTGSNFDDDPASSSSSSSSSSMSSSSSGAGNKATTAEAAAALKASSSSSGGGGGGGGGGKRLTGGRHGYGAKLANILAKEFTVETLDPDRGLR